MSRSTPGGVEVIGIAGCSTELPPAVTVWLQRVGDRAARCPDPYDALARLAGGERPAVMIVDMSAVDWEEMDFFDHVANLSRATRVYVTGEEHQHEKIESACARGAAEFDSAAADEDLATARLTRTPPGPRTLVAGSAPGAPTEAAAEARWSRAGEDTAARETPEPHRVESDAASRHEKRPTVRLVNPPEAEAERAETPVPVPWAPSPNRPRRTPPKRSEPEPAGDRGAGSTASPSPVELTPEELAALLGRPSETGPDEAKRKQS